MIATKDHRLGSVLQDGVLNVRKEAGWTSHDVVARIRGRLQGMKLGHAGTLDPAATGVLPLLIGRGTRIADYLVEWDKTYLACLRLGITTDTQDATGTVLQQAATESVTESGIRKVTAEFQGPIRQIPPMYSAVKVGGVPLYKAARAGRDVERQSREVTIFRLDIVDIQIPDVTIRVVCSKGTYVRTLCADIGDRLGVGGHMSSLIRERVGPLMVERALTVDEVESRLKQGTLATSMLSLDEALASLPACIVGAGTARRVLHGMPVSFTEVLRWDGWPTSVGAGSSRAIRLRDESGRLLAIGMLPVSGEIEKPSLSEQSIAVSKVLVTQDDKTVESRIQ